MPILQQICLTGMRKPTSIFGRKIYSNMLKQAKLWKELQIIQKTKKEDGHKLYIITARWLANDEENAITKNNNGIREKMRDTVKGWLRKNNIEYDKIIFSGEDKSKHIIENKIDIMIEDSPNNLKQLSKLTKMICMDWNYNKEVDGEKYIDVIIGMKYIVI